MLYRWLLPIIAAFAVLLGSVTAYAASGLVGETECCCPDPEVCKCHEHDGDERPDDVMKKCGGEAERVAPQVIPAVVPELAITDVATARVVIVTLPEPIPEPRYAEIEIPPF